MANSFFSSSFFRFSLSLTRPSFSIVLPYATQNQKNETKNCAILLHYWITLHLEKTTFNTTEIFSSSLWPFLLIPKYFYVKDQSYFCRPFTWTNRIQQNDITKYDRNAIFTGQSEFNKFSIQQYWTITIICRQTDPGMTRRFYFLEDIQFI